MHVLGVVFISFLGLPVLAGEATLEPDCRCNQSVFGLPGRLVDEAREMIKGAPKAPDVPSCGFAVNSTMPDSHPQRPSEKYKVRRRTLMVVHAEDYYGLRGKPGMDRLIQMTKERNEPVLFMLENEDFARWTTKDRKPDYFCQSSGGENAFDIQTDEIVLAGGLFNACLKNALNVMRKAAKDNHRELITFHLPIDAITTGQHKTVAETILGSSPKRKADYLIGSYAYFAMVLAEEGVKSEFFLDGKNISNPQMTPTVPIIQTIHFKFWSSTDALRRGT